MNRSIIVYALLLAGAMGWAYQTWTHEDELALAEKVVILPGKPEQLTSVVYRSEPLELSIELREDARGRYAWGHTVPKTETETEPEPEPEPDSDGEAPPKPPPPEPEQFKLGTAGDALLEQLAPFVAKRRLEGVGDDDLEALGLAEPEATLEITREGKDTRTFELGGNVFGGANVYVRDPADGAIYLVDAQLIRTLQGATRSLPDRDLTGIDERKVERVTLRVGDRQASFTQHNPDDIEARFWSVAGQEDENLAANAWIGKILTLRSSRYVQEGQTPVDLAHAFDYQVAGQDDTVVTVEVLRNFDDEGQEQFFARSEHTRGLVQLPRAAVSEASANLESVLQAGGA
ncbi:MAG: DUF4340 domain-containing protein [Myxococcales bacterium]|nr:DUF4340 domain-containing protein [Myxococcales bacterium]